MSRGRADACDVASRAVLTLEAEGNHTRAQFWFVMLILLGDVLNHRVDPHSITIH